jgi:2-phosphosulfolactate phosphatase
VIAAGERWRYDDSLRPAVEDHLGAGAILSALVALGHGDGFSPEARAAVDLFDASLGSLDERMHNCGFVRHFEDVWQRSRRVQGAMK